MDTLWLSDPVRAYADWQEREAAGADRRPFAERSIVQHRAMFDRFHRHIVGHNATLASFGPDHIDAFWLDPESASYTPATRMRYLKLIDRLCRHLVNASVRASNPAADLVRDGRWPTDEPPPLFLDEDVDARLQDYVQPCAADDLTQLRRRAIVALFLGTGVTASEGRNATRHDLHPDAQPPYLHVPGKGPKMPRTVHLEAFAAAPLEAWLKARPQMGPNGDRLFTLTSAGTPITDMSFGIIVRAAFEAIAYRAPDMSPRILRNTYCRRALLRGMAADDVSRRLGLASNRTVDRIRSTIVD